jgi:hypothetical protein
VQSQRRDELGKKVIGFVWLCDSELEEAVEEELDELLDFFSCPMRALQFLSISQRKSEIRRLVTDDTFEKQSSVLQAHCKSFKNLQFLASEMKRSWVQKQESNM